MYIYLPTYLPICLSSLPLHQGRAATGTAPASPALTARRAWELSLAWLSRLFRPFSMPRFAVVALRLFGKFLRFPLGRFGDKAASKTMFSVSGAALRSSRSPRGGSRFC